MKSQIDKIIVANRILTPDGTLLWSRYTHDYVSYVDDNGETYMTDGGPGLYCRRSVNKIPCTDVSVYSDAPWEIQREVRLWGTRGLWIPVSKLSNEHLRNIIREGFRNAGVLHELAYRIDHNIEIPEYEYSDEGVKSITKNYKA